MQPFSALTVAFSLALSVSSLVVPRTNPPAGWNAAILENYDTYHTRYMALSCNTKHSTSFFDQCCHPLLATQSLAKDRPAQCNPAANSKTAAAAAATATATSSSNDGDDDLPFCDDGDDDDNTASTTTAVAAQAKTTAQPAATSVQVQAKTTTTAAAAPKKVVTSAKPAATTAAANTGSSSVNTGGFATFFYQNGVAGACGTVHKDTDMIAAIDGDRYGNLGAKSSLCGKQVHITNTKNGKSVTVTIADACPTCLNGNSIDLSQSAFEAIGSLSEGLLPISWTFA